MNDAIQKYINERSAVKIAEGIEAAVDAGEMPAGTPLPTVRGLATTLGVSPATIAAAYKTLALRGVCVADGRRGTRISGRSPSSHPRPAATLPPGIRDLAFGNPDPALLPGMAEVLRAIDPSPRLYGEGLNLPALERIAAEDLAADGLPSGPLCIVSGAMAGIEHVLGEWLRPGDRVAVEDPGFRNVSDVVLSLGLVLLPVRVDAEGMRPESLDRAVAAGARGMVLTPRAQNPTGAALTTARAEALRAILARAPELLVVEDDHAGMVSGAPPVFVGGAARARWAVVRSFSKALNPDLRLAVLAGDAETLARVQDRLTVGERWVSHILQRIAAALLADPAVRGALELASATYARRRQALIDALAGVGLEAMGRSGFNVWLPVPEEAAVVQALWLRGWAVSAGERFRLQAPPAIRITAATLTEAEAPRLAADIAAVLRGGGRSGAV